MKTMILRLTYILLILVLIAGCTSIEEAEPVSSGANAIICEVYYRPSVGGGLQVAPEITFSEGNKQKEHKFETMSFEAMFQDDQFEGRALSIAITNLDTGVEISRQLYQFDPENPIENQFIGGHGFTGLNYVFHPDSSAEMQYFCSVISE